ncbi:MAG: peptidylprolyl isomerase [Candidatus Cloacimonetes bacterium]|nr:peptidylprolyl isomerase [Candidatus Cloacimonadota bacterium]
MIIARINDYEISAEEFQAELTRVLEKMRIEQPTEEAKEMAIQQLIDGYLLLCQARKSQLLISQEEIESRFIDISLQYNSETEFKEALTSMCFDESMLRDKIRDELIIKKYVSTKFHPTNMIPVQKLEEIYLENRESFVTQEMVKASHILISEDGDNGYRKALVIRNAIKSPIDFLKKARNCSDCPSCCRSGNLGYFPRGKMVKEFEDAAFALKINEISEPVKTQFGYHIIMVTGRKESRLAPFDEVKDALKQRLEQIDCELKLLRHLRELRSKAQIEIFSDLF